MAKKSKTQRAKASAARAQKKMEQELAATTEEEQKVEAQDAKSGAGKKQAVKKVETSEKKPVKKEEKKPAKKRLQFFHDVRAELKRVTWPTRQDVLRWSGVVLAALVFFGLFTYGFDTLFQLILTAYSGLGV